jgi:pimeloyl-ACP methyl ester carboxylesterase
MLIDIGDIRLNYVEWGSGETVVFIHGNLACGTWFDLVGPLVSQNFRVIAVDWRGCGASDKPTPLPDYSNYTVRQHAVDLLAAMRCLGIDRCHLATHSTGGLISTYMVLMEPERFGKVLALNPVGPMGLPVPPESFALLEAMKGLREKTRATLALTAPTLFAPETLTSGMQPMFADHATPAQKQLFERLVDQTLQVSDGIWFGTAIDLHRHWRTGGLRTSQGSIEHRHWCFGAPLIRLSRSRTWKRCPPTCRIVISLPYPASVTRCSSNDRRCTQSTSSTSFIAVKDRSFSSALPIARNGPGQLLQLHPLWLPSVENAS